MEVRLESKNVYDDDFEIDEIDSSNPVRIVVIGVGGGGGNAVVHMADEGIEMVEYLAANTDVDALRKIDATKIKRIQIGKKCARGRGAGANPQVGRNSAEEAREILTDFISKGPDNRPAEMVFVSAGMGGGTGTGAAPIIAGIAKELGVLTVGVVTKPFEFEREAKMKQALAGIEEMRKVVDSLVVIPNEKINTISNNKLTFQNAFKEVDDVLFRAVKGIVDIVHDESYVNVDFADVCTILRESGVAHMAIGHGRGENAVDDALNEVINCPLLETSISGARRMLINLVLPLGALFDQGSDILAKVSNQAAKDVQVVNGISFDESLEDDEISITVIATDFAEPEKKKPAPAPAQTAQPAQAPAQAAQPAKAPVQQPAPRRHTAPAGPEFLYDSDQDIVKGGTHPAQPAQTPVQTAQPAQTPAQQPEPRQTYNDSYTSSSSSSYSGDDDVDRIIGLIKRDK